MKGAESSWPTAQLIREGHLFKHKKAVFYYSKVIKGNRWSPTGWLTLEPLRVEGYEAIGKQPEFCCSRLESAVKHESYGTFAFIAPSSPWENPPYMALVIDNRNYDPISYCPYCGAEIEMRENLSVRIVETSKTRIDFSNHYEAVKP